MRYTRSMPSTCGARTVESAGQLVFVEPLVTPTVVIFGAGHVGCAVLNFFGLKDQIEFVVDDDPHMRGLFMPGSGLPILGSKAIYEKDVKLCILTMKTPSDEKVVKNNQRFSEKGGAFVSIFPESRWAIKF